MPIAALEPDPSVGMHGVSAEQHVREGGVLYLLHQRPGVGVYRLDRLNCPGVVAVGQQVKQAVGDYVG